MSKFRVKYTPLSEYTVDIEAESEAEAMKKASDADGAEFTEVGIGDWEYSDIEEIK